MRSKDPRQSGFTLIEVIAALAICTAAAVALYQGIAVGLKSAGAASGESRALSLAQSLLARAGIEEPLDVGVREGEAEGGLLWSVSTVSYREEREDRQARDTRSLKSYWVKVEVAWRDGRPGRRRSIQLTTLKIDETPSFDRR